MFIEYLFVKFVALFNPLLLQFVPVVKPRFSQSEQNSHWCDNDRRKRYTLHPSDVLEYLYHLSSTFKEFKHGLTVGALLCLHVCFGVFVKGNGNLFGFTVTAIVGSLSHCLSLKF